MGSLLIWDAPPMYTTFPGPTPDPLQYLPDDGVQMAYYLNLFSPETYEAFSKSDRTVTGFRPNQKNARKVKKGDRFICYMTKVSRWVGVLEVESDAFEDSTPIFYESDDPFVLRFKVKPIYWLRHDRTVPITEPDVWNALSFTKNVAQGSPGWATVLRGSLVQFHEHDARFLEKLIEKQTSDWGKSYPIDEDEWDKHLTHRVRTGNKIVSVTVPQDEPEEEKGAPIATLVPEVRESIKVQALLAELGARMGFKVWIPKNDRAAVEGEWQAEHKPVLKDLPLSYDQTTLKTVEQIDVLWLKGRAIMRAFEVEHTTAIYSGILRMADLLALQPNMDIRLHIVAPDERKDKVFQEIRRPVFSLLDRGPLSESCTFISYDSLHDIMKLKHLHLMSHDIMDEYAEPAD